MNKHPNEAFIDLNIRSKILNLSEIARRLDMKNLYNRLHGIGNYKPLTTDELLRIEEIVKSDLNL